MNYVVLAGAITLFVLGGALLERLGWNFASEMNASAIVKLHPSFYIFGLATVVCLGTLQNRYFQTLRTFRYGFFIVSALALSAYAGMISASTAGAQSAAIVTYLMPALMLVAFQALSGRDVQLLGKMLRVFFVFNSLMAIAEQVMGGRFIASFLDLSPNEWRSAALLGHPLNGALLTGLMIVYLATARNLGRSSIRWFELGLHAIAMFAFGGRSSLVMIPAVIAFSVLTARARKGERKISALQRIAPILVLALGLSVVFLPLPFISTALERFTNDRGSSDTRWAAIEMLQSLDWRGLLLGVSFDEKVKLMTIFKTQAGIELAWASMIIVFGLILTIPIAASLVTLLFGLAKRLDRSAGNMALLFLILTAGSLSIGSKSLLVAQALVMIIALCQPASVTVATQAALRNRAFRGSRLATG